MLRHCCKLSCVDGKRTIRQHCCKCTFSDGENRTMASQPNLSSKYLNVPALRHCCTFCCIPGKNNMMALLQIYLHKWQEQDCKLTFTDDNNRMMASELEFFQRTVMSQCCDIAANCPVLMAREPYDSTAANAPSLMARTERWHQSQSSLQRT